MAQISTGIHRLCFSNFISLAGSVQQRTGKRFHLFFLGTGNQNDYLIYNHLHLYTTKEGNNLAEVP